MPRSVKKPLLILTVVLLMIPIGEILVRLLTDVQPPLVTRDARLGRRFIPSFEGQVFDPKAQREVLVRTNRDGFRGPDRPEEAPPGVVRIALTGDSMIAALAVDEERSLCARLEALLDASHPSVDWEVLNFGTLRSSTGQECLIYEQVARRYAPDLVLCALHSGNDLGQNSRQLTSNSRIYFDFDESGDLVQLPFSASRSLASRWLNLNSRLYVWQKQLFRRSRARSIVAAPLLRESDWVYCTEPPEPIAHAWRITSALLERFRDAVAADGAAFALVHVPDSRQIYADAFEGLLELAGDARGTFERDHPDAKLGSICAELELPFLSLTAGLRGAAPSDSVLVEEEWLYIGGGGHWNERGNAVAAETLHALLTARGKPGMALVDEVLSQNE